MSQPLYNKSVVCPVCEKEFKTLKVRSSAVKILKRDEDFCTYYQDINPIFYDVFVCPECGYAAMEKYFETISPMSVKDIKEKVASKWNRVDYCAQRTIEDAINCYKLSLYCSLIKGDKSSIIAATCLRLAWLYRYKGEKEEEKRFLKSALENYIKAFNTENFPIGKMTELELMYLIGTLYYKLGSYKDAIQWYSRVVSHPQRRFYPVIISMAREQWYKLREANEE